MIRLLFLGGWGVNEQRVLHGWMEISHISVSVFSSLLGCQFRARFMVPTDCKFFPSYGTEISYWHRFYSFKSLTGGHSQVKTEVWIMACALAAQSCCVAPRKPLLMSTQTSTFTNTLIAHLLPTPSPFESIPLWPFWGYRATWLPLAEGRQHQFFLHQRN